MARKKTVFDTHQQAKEIILVRFFFLNKTLQSREACALESLNNQYFNILDIICYLLLK